MDAMIIKKNIENEFFIEERCFIIDSTNKSDGGMSIAIARVEPGITTAFHYLEGIDERYLVISGKGIMEIDGHPKVTVSSGDIVYIPAGVKQRIINIGGQDLVFYCVCTPPFNQDRYRTAGG